MEEIHNILKKNPNNNKACVELLQYIRSKNLRESDLVIKYGQILFNNGYSLGSEEWVIREQIFIAALDRGEHKIATVHFKCLQLKFGPNHTKKKAMFDEEEIEFNCFNSARITLLYGMLKEAAGKYKVASCIMDHLLKENPSNPAYLRRKIAIYKALDAPDKVIKALKKYLNVFQVDHVGWLELADVYIAQCKYEEAAFCFEEIILLNPNNPHIYTKYAEVLYTIGGEENYITARKYFSHALNLSINISRAKFGLLTTCLAISNLNSKTIDQDLNNQLLSYSKKLISDIYSQTNQKQFIDYISEITLS
eukprot:TRINITY_DN3377_c1_g1_i1.p1 TRINITY_DN3377_c1_g1~~TRINITY_DN3377_c1_g1_i1.p1  ORF type:complete len:308 (+),score=68.97 TRINITY_DN3377_c1_g1_i1:106-1029(+)